MLNFIMLAILALSITLTYVEIKTGKITMFFFYWVVCLCITIFLLGAIFAILFAFFYFS